MGENNNLLPTSTRQFYYRAKLLGYMWFDNPLPDTGHPEEAIGLPVPQDDEHQQRVRAITELARNLEEDQLQQLSATLTTPHYVLACQQEQQPIPPIELEHEAKEQAERVLDALQQLQASTDAPYSPPTSEPPD
jgi:hypothetical protein